MRPFEFPAAAASDSPPGKLLRWVAVWQRNFKVWQKLAGPSILGNFGEPLLYLLALGYGLGSFVGEIGDMPYIVYLASGIVCSSAMMTASFEGMYSAYTRMAVQRTWDAMLATPIDVRDVVIGEAVWCATKSLISATAILIVASLLGAVGSGLAVLALPVIFLMGLCFGGLALVITSFAKGYDFFLYFMTLVITPMLLIGGVFFPLEQMPGFIQTASALLPLTHTVKLVRPMVTGVPADNALLHLAVLAAYAVGTVSLAIHLLTKRMTA